MRRRWPRWLRRTRSRCRLDDHEPTRSRWGWAGSGRTRFEKCLYRRQQTVRLLCGALEGYGMIRPYYLVQNAVFPWRIRTKPAKSRVSHGTTALTYTRTRSSARRSRPRVYVCLVDFPVLKVSDWVLLRRSPKFSST
jgi:hypothetical protein